MEEKTHFYGFVNDICDPFRTDILYFLSPYRAACFVSYRFDDVEMKCSNIDQAGCQLKQLYSMKFASFLFSLSFSILSTNLMLNRDKKKKEEEEEKMWVERLSFVFVYTCTLSPSLNADAPFQINLCTHTRSNKHDH